MLQEWFQESGFVLGGLEGRMLVELQVCGGEG
jgi:hypothetical protein